MAAIALALGTAACYGVANFLGPLLGRRHALAVVLLTGQLAALVASVVVLTLVGEAFPDGHGLWLGAAAGLANAVGLAGLYRAAELGPISVAAPIGATGSVLPVMYGLVEGEALRGTEAAGLLFAITGVVLAARRPTVPGAPSEGDLRGCIAFAVLSAIGFGTFLILLPKASAHGRFWSLLDARLALVAFLVVLYGLRRELAAPPGIRAAAQMAVPGLLLIGGTLLYVLAGERGSLSVVAVLASLNTVFTVTLAFLVLRERLARIQTIGVGLAIAGVILVVAVVAMVRRRAGRAARAAPAVIAIAAGLAIAGVVLVAL